MVDKGKCPDCKQEVNLQLIASNWHYVKHKYRGKHCTGSGKVWRTWHAE
jgi:hypothetical protein